MIQRKLILNAIMCLRCGDVLESLYRNDYKTCSCTQHQVGIDGGTDYRKFTGGAGSAMDLAKYSNGPWEQVRKVAYRLGYGKPGSIHYGHFKKTTFDKMTNEHLEASLIFKSTTPGGFHWQMLLEEKLYRNEKEIFIED